MIMLSEPIGNIATDYIKKLEKENAELKDKILSYNPTRQLELEQQLADISYMAEQIKESLFKEMQTVRELEKQLADKKYLDRQEVENAIDSVDPGYRKHYKIYYNLLVTAICKLAIQPITKDRIIPEGAIITSAVLHYDDGSTKELTIDELNEIIYLPE